MSNLRTRNLRPWRVSQQPLDIECLACGSTLRFEPGATSMQCSLCEEARPLPLRFYDIPETAEGEGGESSAHGLLPFLLDEPAARRVLTREALRLDKAPLFDDLHRAFLPALVMRCHVRGTYTGQRGEAQGHGHMRRVVWVRVSGLCERPFENVIRYPNAAISAEHYDDIRPWDWAFTRPLDDELAQEEYEEATVHPAAFNPAEVFERFFPDVDEDMTMEAMSAIGGEEQRVTGVTSVRKDAFFRVVLLPVWVGRLESADAQVVVNGRNGRVSVEGYASTVAEATPFDPGRLTLWDNLQTFVYAAMVIGGLLVYVYFRLFVM